MTVWHRTVTEKLRVSGLFTSITLVGAKIRASIDDVRFLDIYFDPTSHSYSYALIDLRLPYPGDKRLIGWDDYLHEGLEEFRELASHPHHFQRRAKDGSWIFEASPMRGEIEREIELVIAVTDVAHAVLAEFAQTGADRSHAVKTNSQPSQQFILAQAQMVRDIAQNAIERSQPQIRMTKDRDYDALHAHHDASGAHGFQSDALARIQIDAAVG